MNIQSSGINDVKSGISNMVAKTTTVGSIMVDVACMVVVHFIAGHLAVRIATKIDSLSNRK